MTLLGFFLIFLLRIFVANYLSKAKQSPSRSSSLQLTSSLRHDQGIASRQRPYPTLPFAMTTKDGAMLSTPCTASLPLTTVIASRLLTIVIAEPPNYIAGFLFDFLYCEY